MNEREEKIILRAILIIANIHTGISIYIPGGSEFYEYLNKTINKVRVVNKP